MTHGDTTVIFFIKTFFKLVNFALGQKGVVNF